MAQVILDYQTFPKFALALVHLAETRDKKTELEKAVEIAVIISTHLGFYVIYHFCSHVALVADVIDVDVPRVQLTIV
jgi:hypothetical protein